MSLDSNHHTSPNYPRNYRLYATLEQIADGSAPPDFSTHSPISLAFPILCFFLILAILAGCFVSYFQKPTSILVNASVDSSSSAPSSSKKSSKSSSKKSSSSKSSSSKSHSSINKSVPNIPTDSDSSSEENHPDDSYYPFNSVGNSSSNLLNGAFMAMQGDWIYYINSLDNHTVYKMRNSGLEDQQVCDIPASSISLVGESAFIGRLGQSNTLQDIRWDGSGTQLINIGCDSISAFPDYLITSDSLGIYYLDLINSVKRKLYTGSPSNCCVEGDRIYFLENNTLYSMDPFHPDDLQVEASGAIQSYAVTEDAIYYCMRNQLYSTASSNQPLPGLQTSCINITDGILYYANQLDGNRLYSIRLDGTEHYCLSDIPAEAICVSGDWIAIQSYGEIVLL